MNRKNLYLGTFFTVGAVLPLLVLFVGRNFLDIFITIKQQNTILISGASLSLLNVLFYFFYNKKENNRTTHFLFVLSLLDIGFVLSILWIITGLHNTMNSFI